MSARDKFYSSDITRTLTYVKYVTTTFPDAIFMVSSSSTNTILQVLPTSSVGGIRFYASSGGGEITETNRLELRNSVPTFIAARIDTTNFDTRTGTVSFPIKFDLIEVPLPADQPSLPGRSFTCVPCWNDGPTGVRDDACPPGYICENIQGQRCCVEEDRRYGPIEEPE